MARVVIIDGSLFILDGTKNNVVGEIPLASIISTTILNGSAAGTDIVEPLVITIGSRVVPIPQNAKGGLLLCRSHLEQFGAAQSGRLRIHQRRRSERFCNTVRAGIVEKMDAENRDSRQIAQA